MKIFKPGTKVKIKDSNEFQIKCRYMYDIWTLEADWGYVNAHESEFEVIEEPEEPEEPPITPQTTLLEVREALLRQKAIDDEENKMSKELYKLRDEIAKKIEKERTIHHYRKKPETVLQLEHILYGKTI